MSSAKKKSGPAAVDPTAILEGLRRGLDGPKLLVGKPAAGALFPNTAPGKQAAQAALDQGYLITRNVTIPPATKRGKEKTETQGELTDRGRQHVLETDNPKKILEALLPAVKALAPISGPSTPLDVKFKEEIEKVANACVKSIQDAFTKLQQTIEKSFAKLEQTIEKALPKRPDAPVVDAGPVLIALQAALARIEVGHAPTTEQIRTALRKGYDHLCLFVEFRDKLVEIPRLYHETVRLLPGLTVEQFHRELEVLNSEWKIELHKLNEVRLAQQRDLAIEKDGHLFYYVLWK